MIYATRCRGAFASLAPTLLFGAWFISRLGQGGRSIDTVHGGYLLPTVAAAFLVGQGAGTFGWTLLSEAAIAVGILFWVVLGSVILARMAFRPALPETGLLGTFVLLILLQVMMLARYVRLPFTLRF